MSYVDALYERDKNRILVAERINGRRVFAEFPAEYTFYFDDNRGKFRTVYDTPVSQFTTASFNIFKKESRMHSKGTIWESDISPVARCLEKHYKGSEPPQLHTAFFDIEVDFDKIKGFSPTDDPFNKVTAISTYLTATDDLITQVIAPDGMPADIAKDICDQFENTILYTSEKEMMIDWLDIIEDADVLSGWNSEGYDIPYMVNRITRILSKDDTRRLCLWNKLPKKRMFERFGKESVTFDLIGRVHLDYMQLYKKYTYEERHSYSLDAIGSHELNETKVAYEGSLDQLYNSDFKKFIDYNRQDTLLLYKLDKKLKFIDLGNSIAHENTVQLPKVMGAVAQTEQAIINEAHEHGLIVPNKTRHNENTQAAGAYVMYPKKGLHKWVGSVDINSLYPSAIRALNMAPETIIGQLSPIETDKYIAEKMADVQVQSANGKLKMKKGMKFAAAWEGLFGSLEYTAVMEQRTDFEITVDWDKNAGGEIGTLAELTPSTKMTGKEIFDLIFKSDNPWVLSANGTIFDVSKVAIIPGLLERWYAERKVMQAKKQKAIDAGLKADIEYWDKRQLVKKINLNSLYGAILNPHCRFFDKRIGQSTTLTGRTIAKHMDAYVNECLTGEYDHVGETIVYGDTDSAYFSAWPVIKDEVQKGNMDWNVETAISLYDSLADECNISFPGMMHKSFNCPRDFGKLIVCGREAVASNGLFITKKRYALMVVDNEGKRLDTDDKPGKMKAMGLDLRRSDTPVIVQDFLKDILTDTLVEAEKDIIIGKIIDFKEVFKNLPSWEKGMPKAVNNLTKYSAIIEQEKKTGTKGPMVPGHVRASYNYNQLRRMHSDNFSMAVEDGTKAIVCKLKENPMRIASVARPTDEKNIPEWFKELPFDDEAMATSALDKKVDNLLGVLNWDIATLTDTSSTFNNLFEFE